MEFQRTVLKYFNAYIICFVNNLWQSSKLTKDLNLLVTLLSSISQFSTWIKLLSLTKGQSKFTKLLKVSVSCSNDYRSKQFELFGIVLKLFQLKEKYPTRFQMELDKMGSYKPFELYTFLKTISNVNSVSQKLWVHHPNPQWWICIGISSSSFNFAIIVI